MNYKYRTTGEYKQINSNYGIVESENGEEFFIFRNNKKSAFSGDIVEIGITKEAGDSKKAEAEVIKVLRRTRKTLVGEFFKSKKSQFGFVRPNNSTTGKDIFISQKDSIGYFNGDIVSVVIISGNDRPSGRIINKLGSKLDLDIQEKIILSENEIELEFSQDVIKEAEKLSFKNIGGKRKDFINLTTVTIDSEDAKDLDDAISVTRIDNGNYELYVHIADVAEYVTSGSILDKEALKRTTSIYMPGKVIPMLPQKLSDDLCSLNAQTKKAALSIKMEIDPETGKVIKSEVFESVIISDGRLTYTGVKDYLEGNSNMISKLDEPITISKEVRELLDNANKLYKIIKKRRELEGKIEFDFPELKIEVDESGSPVKVSKRDRNEAHKLIEEFMITANEEISKKFSFLKIPFLYRVHEKPDLESVDNLISWLKNKGIVISKDHISPLFINQLLRQIKERPDSYAIEKQILQAMSKAKYSKEILGHFGLALTYYSHFTSPIRRYPDLQIHRIIKLFLRGKKISEITKEFSSKLKKVAEICSMGEQKAENIERKIIQLKSIEYMSSFIGKEFKGSISGISALGFYVELESGIEGFVIRKGSEERFKITENNENVIINSGGKEIIKQLGDNVSVMVLKADKRMGFLDFKLK